MKNNNKKVDNIIITLIITLYIIWSVIFIYKSSFIAIDNKRYFCLFDDAMISMRYAWNFSHGHGLVWNDGVYIQGFTNLLMTLLMSLITLVFEKSISVLAVQVLGVGFMALSAIFSMKIVDLLILNKNDLQRSIIKILVVFCVLAFYPLSYWTLMGMETGLFTLLMLLSIYYSLKFSISINSKYLVLVTMLLGFLYITRNDSLIIACLILLYLLVTILKSSIVKKRGMIRYLFLSSFILLFFILCTFVFQYLYYGEFFPNTFTLKLTGLDLSTRLANGWGFIKPFMKICTILWIFSIIETICNFRVEKLLLLLISFAFIAYQIYIGGDPWIYWRLVSPMVPLLLVLFVISLTNFTNSVPVTSWKHKNAANLFSLLMIVTISCYGIRQLDSMFLREILFLDPPYSTEANENNVNTAIVLNEITTKDASIAVFWAGSIPYYLDRYAIDFLGKSDKFIAQLAPDVSGATGWSGMNSVPGHNKYDLNYTLKKLRPTYAQYFKWGNQDLTEWAKSEYVTINYKGVNVNLLSESPNVLWEKVGYQASNK